MNQGLTADSIFVNGKVITVDSQFSIAQAVAVYGGKIVAVGTTEEVETLAGDGTQRVDLQGRTMLPGINDSHIHLSQSGLLLGKGLNRGQVMMREEPWTPEGLREAYRTAWDTCCKLGVTSVTDGDLGTKGNGERGGACGTLSLRILNDMHNAGELPVRVNVMLSFGPDHGDDQLEHLTDILPNLGWHSGFGDRKLRIAGLKLFADGCTGMGTAYTYEGNQDGSNGRLCYRGNTDEERYREMGKMIHLAHRYGFTVGIHCCGDKAIDAVADAYIQAQEEDPWDSRDYFIHGDLISPECIRRIRTYSLGYSAFIPAILEKHEGIAGAIGPERCAKLYPLRSLLDAGVVVTAHTDYPFTLTDWRQGLQCCVLRESGDGGEIWGPEERITVEEAIRLYTINGAWQTHEEEVKGSIEVGKLADFCVLGEDILTVDPHRIRDIPVEMTVVGGAIVFRNFH